MHNIIRTVKRLLAEIKHIKKGNKWNLKEIWKTKST